MIYAQIHSYTDAQGNLQNCIASRQDQPDATWVGYSVPDSTWLSISNGVIVVATFAPLPPLKSQALIALDVTDKVAYRCFKAGIAFPAVWQSYTIALRAIVNGADTTSTSLPTQPPYPPGT